MFYLITFFSESAEVLTIEFKINFLKPALPSRILAVGKVIQSGKRLTVCEGFVFDESETTLLAKMTETIMNIN